MLRLRRPCRLGVERLGGRVMPSAGLAHHRGPALIASDADVGSIEGTVTASRPGANVAGVSIQLIQLVSLSARVISSTQADASGRFAFDGLKRGDYAVREAGQVTAKPDSVFLNGTPVDVGDVDLVTGGPYPATQVAYRSNGTVLTADSPGPTVLSPRPDLSSRVAESPTAGAFQSRANLLRQGAIPYHNYGSRQAIIDGSYYGLKTILRIIL